MGKKFLIVLFAVLTVVLSYNISYAATKDDIIGYVNAQNVCGDTGLFNSYKSTFTRLLKQKNLSEKELNTIYSYLTKSVGILNSKGVCKLADVDKLTSAEKTAVYNNLYAGANIITSAPNIGVDSGIIIPSDKQESEIADQNNNKNNNTTETGTKVTINTEDNTMDIYEGGILIDKVNLNSQKMTYTGPNITNMVICIVLSVLFIAVLICYMLLAKKHTAKVRFVKNFLVSTMICSSLIFIVITVFGSKFEEIKSVISLVSFNQSDDVIDVKIDENKNIVTYPSYAANYATLKIPSLDIERKVFFGDAQMVLSLGVGHSTWSDMPTEGNVVVYSGHNRDNMLGCLKNIKKGDSIVVDTTYAKCTYKVSKTEVLKDTDIDKLVKINNKETLIVYTCYPFDTYVYSNQRYVVFATLSETSWK